MGFGYKTAWIAARTSDGARLGGALGLRNLAPSASETAVAAACGSRGKAFVTPPIEGWSLCVSDGLFAFADTRPPEFGELTAKLSAHLGCEVQFFASHRVLEAHGWARAVGGTLVRAYLYVGEQGEKVIEVGPPTAEERELGLAFFDPTSPDASTDGYWERDELQHVDEEHVMMLAGRWSLNPTELDGMGDGILGDMSERPSRGTAASNPATSPGPAKAWWKFW